MQFKDVDTDSKPRSGENKAKNLAVELFAGFFIFSLKFVFV